jgi:hypothetical protein|tara:strand:- start:981 stop:1184 length:204 start_codon:yes stop_codon:yes gene_type:complete
MQVGDLVYMPSDWRNVEGRQPVIGIVVDANLYGDRRLRRIGVFWQDGDRVDYEPIEWLEVINATKTS